MSKTQIATGGIADDAVSEEHLDATAITGTTALTVEPATTDEILISDAGTLKRLDLSLLMNQPSFFVVASGNQSSIANNTWTKLTLDSEVFDAGGTFASSKFTPAISGFYVIHFGTYIAGLDDGENLNVILYKNGSSYGYGHQTGYVSTSNGDPLLTSSTVIQLDTDDYVELYCKHNEGSAQTAYAANTFMFGYKTLGTL